MKNDWSKIIEFFELQDFLKVKAPDRVIKNYFWNDKDGNDIKSIADEYVFCCLHEDSTFTDKLGKKIIKEDLVINQLRLAESEKDFNEICNRELKKHDISEKDKNIFLEDLTKHLKQLINNHKKNIEYDKRNYNCLLIANDYINYIDKQIPKFKLDEPPKKTDKDNTNKLWFKVGVLLATGKIDMKLKNHNKAISQLAKDLENINYRPYINQSVNNTNKKSDKNIFNYNYKLLEVYNHCINNKITVISDFKDKIQFD